jgi:hypothetical protein
VIDQCYSFSSVPSRAFRPEALQVVSGKRFRAFLIRDTDLYIFEMAKRVEIESQNTSASLLLKRQ